MLTWLGMSGNTTPFNTPLLPSYFPFRNAEAIPIFEEAVKAAESDEDIMRAYVGLVTAQARTQVDYHPVLYQFKSAIGNPGLWEKGLLVMCDNLTGDNIVSDSESIPFLVENEAAPIVIFMRPSPTA